MDNMVRKTILLVEDEAIIALGEKLALEKYGYKVIATDSGESAIQVVDDTPSIDLILMDINLGKGIDGSEAAERILAEHEIPVVFLSSHTDPAVVDKTEKISSYGYVVKNAGITVLDASIKMAFKLFEANRKYRTVNNKLRATIDALPDLLFEIGLDGEFHDVHSPGDAPIFGPGGSRPKRNIREILPPETANIIMSAVREANQNGFCFGRQYELQVPAGKRCFELFVSRVAGSLENPRFIYLSRDVTEYRRAREELEKSERQFRSMFENAPIGVFYSTAGGKILRVNAEYARIFGFSSPEETIRVINGSSAADVLFDLPDERARLVREAMRSPGSWMTLERTYRKKDGSHVFAHLVFRALPEDPEIMEGFVEDIGGRKRAEEDLEEKILLMKAITDSAQDAIVMLDENGSIRYWNPSAERIFGYAAGEAMGKRFHELIAPERYRERAKAAFGLFQATGRGDYIGTTSELEGLMKDGKEVPLELSLSAVNYQDSWHSVGIIRDITERKRAEESIRRLLAEKEMLLREVHHRVKNNLASIQALLSLQASTFTEPGMIAAFDDTGNRVRSMMILYDKLYQSKDFTSVSTSAYLPPLIDEMISTFPNRAKVKIEKHIEDIVLTAQKMQPLGIIINELLTNAMKYAFVDRDHGTLGVSISLKGNTVSLVIQDDGKGAPESAGFENPNGFGLVLVEALARQIAGSVRMEKGDGTRVVLEFEK